MYIVTGANGFIGSVMVWELNQRNLTDIVCVDSVDLTERNLLRKKKYSHFLLKNELSDFLKTKDSQKIKWIFHLGACSSTTETNREFLMENNTQYTQKIFDWCTINKKNLIYASSAATYGAGENGFDDNFDSSKLKPLNLYGESKLLFDQWALQQKNTPPHWYGLKFFNVFGPNEYLKGPMASVAFKAYNQIKETEKLGLFKSYNFQYKDGEQMRDFVYVKDVTRWMWELTEKKPSNGIYNMGFGRAQTWLDLAKSIFNAMKKPMKINWLEMPENIKNQYQYFTEAKMDKWNHAGLSKPQWSLENAVQDYVQNYLDKSDPLL